MPLEKRTGHEEDDDEGNEGKYERCIFSWFCVAKTVTNGNMQRRVNVLLIL